MKDTVHKIKGQPAHRQMAITNFQLDRAAQADKVSDGVMSTERKATGNIR